MPSFPPQPSLLPSSAVFTGLSSTPAFHFPLNSARLSLGTPGLLEHRRSLPADPEPSSGAASSPLFLPRPSCVSVIFEKRCCDRSTSALLHSILRDVIKSKPFGILQEPWPAFSLIAMPSCRLSAPSCLFLPFSLNGMPSTPNPVHQNPVIPTQMSVPFRVLPVPHVFHVSLLSHTRLLCQDSGVL